MKNDTGRSTKRPFFARFLEGQGLRVKTDVKAGGGTKPQYDVEYTQKYPSDGDEV